MTWSCPDHVRLEHVEDRLVDIPTVEHGGGLPAKVAGGGRGNAVEQFAVGVSADHNAALAMPSQEHAQAAWVEVEGVRYRRTGERVPRNHELERQPLKPVRS